MNVRRDANLCLWCDEMWSVNHDCEYAPNSNCMFTFGEDNEGFAFVTVTKEGLKHVVINQMEDEVHISQSHNLFDKMCEPNSCVPPAVEPVSIAPKVFDEMPEPISCPSQSRHVSFMDGSEVSYDNRVIEAGVNDFSLVDKLQDVIATAHKTFDKMHVPDFMLEMAQATLGESVDWDRDVSCEIIVNPDESREYERRMLAELGELNGSYFRHLVFIGAVIERFSTLGSPFRSYPFVSLASLISEPFGMLAPSFRVRNTHYSVSNRLCIGNTIEYITHKLIMVVLGSIRRCISRHLPADNDHKMVTLATWLTTNHEHVSYDVNTLILILAFGSDMDENWVMCQYKLFDPGKEFIVYVSQSGAYVVVKCAEIDKEAWGYVWYILANVVHQSVMWNIWPTTICFDWVWSILYFVQPHIDEFDSSQANLGKTLTTKQLNLVLNMQNDSSFWELRIITSGRDIRVTKLISSCTLTLEDKGNFRGEEEDVYILLLGCNCMPSHFCVFDYGGIVGASNMMVSTFKLFDPGGLYWQSDFNQGTRDCFRDFIPRAFSCSIFCFRSNEESKSYVFWPPTQSR